MGKFLALAEAAGVPVFPVGENKRPLTAHGFSDESDDPATLARWAGIWPDANYAYRPWHMGCVVLDLDHAKPGGVDPACLALLPSTYTVWTPSGGEHRYYLTDIPWANSRPWRNVDIRCANGYVLGPGSVINGVAYTIIDDRDPVPLPDAVAKLLSVIRQAAGSREDALRGGEIRYPEPAESPAGAKERALRWLCGYVEV